MGSSPSKSNPKPAQKGQSNTREAVNIGQNNKEQETSQKGGDVGDENETQEDEDQEDTESEENAIAEQMEKDEREKAEKERQHKKIKSQHEKVKNWFSNTTAEDTDLTGACIIETHQALTKFIGMHGLDKTDLHIPDVEEKVKDILEYESVDDKLKKEGKRLLLQISKHASAKMKYNNPNIADLSDGNRATKLAERLSEVYDNDWTDVFEFIRTKVPEKNMPDQQIIEFLRDTLNFCYDQCVDVAEVWRSDMIRELLLTGSDVKQTPHDAGIGVPVLEYMRRATPIVLQDVHDVIYNQLKGKFSNIPRDEIFRILKTGKHLHQCYQTFFRNSTEICWYCRLQSPPTVMKFEGNADNSVFRQYTQIGTQIEYVVWPVLLLHERGPVLGKGVAQYKKRTSPEVGDDNGTRSDEIKQTSDCVDADTELKKRQGSSESGKSSTKHKAVKEKANGTGKTNNDSKGAKVQEKHTKKMNF